MKHLKLFEKLKQYESYKNGSDYVLPNVSYVEETKDVKYERKKAFTLRATYNATPDNLVAFTGASNIKSLNVNGTPIKIEPIKNEITTFDVLGENISMDMETGYATFPESYLIKSPVSSWSFKAKDPNYTINENTYICMLSLMDGNTMAQPMPFNDVNGYAFTTNDGITIEAIDAFLGDNINMQIQSGTQIGFTIVDMDVNNRTFTFIDTEHQTSVTTGGLSTYAFDNEGSYDVKIELADPDMKGIQFTGTPLISIEISDGITSIGEGTFESCDSLTSVTIGDSVTTIGAGAFSDCSSLTSIIIPNSVTTIGDCAFYCCSKLTSINIPNSVTSIGMYAFQSCTGELIINNKIVENNYASNNYPSYYGWLEGAKFETLKIGDSVTSIGDYAFFDCTSLTSITIPDSVNTIGTYAFSGCSSLTSVYITDIAAWCNISFSDSYSNPLYYADSLYLNDELVTDLTIPNSVTSIAKDAFYTCKSITSVTISNSVTSIGERAFYQCSGLTDVTIPEGVNSIGSSAFYGCGNLTNVYISDIYAWCNISFSGLYSNPLSNGCNIYLNDELVTDLTIPDSVTSIGNGVFAYCDSLISVTIPDSVTSIGQYAFQQCTNLQSVTIGDSVTTIGIQAFQQCTNLQSVTIGNGVITIENKAFYKCSGLTNIDIPDSVISIGKEAFYQCRGLTDVTIPNSVTSIGDGAFWGCSSLTTITCYATTAPSIKSNTFYGVPTDGTLCVPAGSDYSSWMRTSTHYLGYYHWTIQYI